MIIKGFKAFYRDMKNNYGVKYEEGRTYYAKNAPKFGLNGNGFHLCKNIEDTFRFINDSKPQVAKVIAKGKIVEGRDDYNSYFNMYASTVIKIEHILSREEIIDEICKRSVYGVIRAIIYGYDFTEEEIEIIRKKFKYNKSLEKNIDYYINGNKDAFSIQKRKMLKR